MSAAPLPFRETDDALTLRRSPVRARREMWRFAGASVLCLAALGTVALLYDVFSIPFTCGLCLAGPLLLLFGFGVVERYAVSRFGDETVFDKTARELRRNGDVIAPFAAIEAIEIAVDERRRSPFLNITPLRLYLRIRDGGDTHRYRILDETDRAVIDTLAERLSSILNVPATPVGRLAPRRDR